MIGFCVTAFYWLILFQQCLHWYDGTYWLNFIDIIIISIYQISVSHAQIMKCYFVFLSWTVWWNFLCVFKLSSLFTFILWHDEIRTLIMNLAIEYVFSWTKLNILHAYRLYLSFCSFEVSCLYTNVIRWSCSSIRNLFDICDLCIISYASLLLMKWKWI